MHWIESFPYSFKFNQQLWRMRLLGHWPILLHLIVEGFRSCNLSVIRPHLTCDQSLDKGHTFRKVASNLLMQEFDVFMIGVGVLTMVFPSHLLGYRIHHI